MTLDHAIETALAAWPSADKDEQSSSDAVLRLMKRLEAGDRGTTAPYIDDDRIFSVPLGQDENPGHNWSAIPGAAQGDVAFETGPLERALEDRMSMSDRERERKSLQDLMALAKSQPRSEREPGEAEGEDSGLIRLASFFEEEKPASQPHADTLAGAPSASSLATASTGPSVGAIEPTSATLKSAVSAAQVEEAMAREAVSARAAEVDRASIPPVTPTSVAPPAVPAPALAKEESGPGVWVIGVGALFGVTAAAAAVFFMLKPAPETAAITPPIESTRMAAPAKANASEPQAPLAENPAARAEPTGEAPAEEIAELPPVEVSTPAAKTTTAKAGAAKVAIAAAPVPATKAEKAETPAPPPPEPAHATGTLAEAMRQAAGPAQSSATEEKAAPGFAAGSVPQKPSQGALTGAIGAALPSARACLGPDDPISRATLTFTSNGSVQSVSVHGAAVGTPAEGCIKAALGKAKLSPFAEATYVTTVTVRH